MPKNGNSGGPTADVGATRLSRRRFLAASAGTALATAAPRVGAASGKGAASTDFDAIVIGGGFAGATAAREIGANGRRVLVLEARPRLGGRTFTSHFADHEVEFGGAWVHWLQPHVWPELLRYGRGVVEDPLVDLDRSIVMFNDGSTKNLDPIAFDQSFQDAFEKFNHDARELFPRPYDPTFNPRALEIDSQSAAERIASLDLTDIQVAQLRGMLALYAGGLTREYGVPGVV
jgi:monoamine oxidase